jgi:hypothetical protein
VSKEPIVFGPTGIEMIDQLLSIDPSSSVQVVLLKSAQQQLGLVEPGRVGRREQNSHSGVMILQPVSGISGRVARPAIPDQMNAPRLAMLVKQLRPDLPQMSAIVALPTPAAHLAGMDHQSHQQMNCPVTDVLKLPTLNVPGARPAGGIPH